MYRVAGQGGKTLKKQMICFLAVLCLFGCGPNKQGADPSHQVAHPDLLIVAIDRSGSTTPFRYQQLDQLDLLATYALSYKIPMEIWTYDHQSQCIFGPRVPPDEYSPEFKDLKARYFAPQHLSRDLGTRPCALFQFIADDPHYRQAARPVVVILTDGDDDDGNVTNFCKQAQALCQGHPSLQLYVIDITPNNRPLWERAFQDNLQNHLQLAGLDEWQSALSSLYRK
jgi:hypothetical protein